MRGIGGRDEIAELAQNIAQPRIGQLVAHSPTVWCDRDQPTAAQARQVVGHIRARRVELFGQLRWMDASVDQRDEDTATGVTRERESDSAEGVQIDASRCSGVSRHEGVLSLAGEDGCDGARSRARVDRDVYSTV